MTARDQMLTRVRGALGRSPNQPLPEPLPVRLQIPQTPLAGRVSQFSGALTELGGTVTIVKYLAGAKKALASIINGRTLVASAAPILEELLDRQEGRGPAPQFSREACTTAEIGVTSADFGLADTGSLVFLSESHESRLISLLPPIHIAVISRAKILSGLDELFTIVPQPADRSSSMVLITGPSRTADIEMRLVRGVHGPGEIHVIIVEDVTTSQGDASGET